MNIAIPKAGRKFKGILTRLAKNKSGLALTEFAYSLPIFTGLGMVGLETAHFTVTQLRVSQAALNLSDNASRMGQATSSATARTVFEGDVNQMLTGMQLQAANIDLFEKGRVVLSSLEMNGDGGQWIHWQRCAGDKTTYTSAYGPENTGSSGTGFAGMGESGNEITATSGSGVMFVEVFYEYEPLFGDMFYTDRVIRHQAAFNIRDTRNLSVGIGSDGETASTCS
ncbi:hypothetical protein MNBD_ALPHA04-102 [hydrothermal vent metagenome]|uniref:Uncharacterized protein n=1 Tax=hydrothermal vent metagenome TaxID=652676 RepID=A0A3B0T370_9ZZZZ